MLGSGGGCYESARNLAFGRMVSLFDTSAREFARSTDHSIAAGRYVRGDMFVRAAKQWIRRGGRVLDFGCGPGRLARFIAQEGYSVVGVDPSSEMIDEASRQPIGGPEIRFVVGPDVSAVDSEGPFAGAICSSVIEYERDPMSLLRGLHATLEPHAALILSYANARSMWRTYARLRNPNAPYLKYQHQVWTWCDCTRHLQAAGFEIVDGPRFFESPFDRWASLVRLSSMSTIGTLGLVVARRS